MLHRKKHYVTATVAVLLSVGAALLVAMKWRQEPASWAPPTASVAVAGDRTGKIILKHGDTCQTLKFDNDTGQVSALAGSCPDATPLDATGVPIPAGTTRRLNAISDSFGNDR